VCHSERVTHPPRTTRALARAATLVGIAALSLALVACSPGAPTATTSPTTTPVAASVPDERPDDGILDFSAYGDSLTAGDADQILLVEEMDESYWQLATALAGVEYRGGWARGGLTSADIAAAATPAEADWAVVLMGTNDIFARGDLEWESWATVWATSGCSRMLVLAIPPIKHQEEEAAEVNVWLEQQADANGVAFFDPWASVRAADGISWREETSFDGIHPAGYEMPPIGLAIADELLRLDALGG
jgi:hypothetical protein